MKQYLIKTGISLQDAGITSPKVLLKEKSNAYEILELASKYHSRGLIMMVSGVKKQISVLLCYDGMLDIAWRSDIMKASNMRSWLASYGYKEIFSRK